MMQPLRNIGFSRPCLGREEADAAAAVVASGWIVGGPRLAELERQFEVLCEAPAAIGVSSWTTGAFLVLKCLGIGPGDEVIVPSLTFIASVNVIVHAGATPVFVDVDPATFNIDPDDIEARITPRTRAILAVDQIGLPCEIDRILALAARHDIIVIQDAACSIGSRFRDRPVGALAPVAIFSLHARKVVTTGEGGMIVTHDQQLAETLRRQRRQGMSLSDYERHNALATQFETYPEVGYNFRLTDIQAGVGVVQMKRLDELLARRRHIAERYLSAFAGHNFIVSPRVPDHVEPNWQSFQLRLEANAPLSRNAVMERLHQRGVATRRGVMASHLEPPYAGMGRDLPHTESAAAMSLQLPMFPDLADADVTYVIDELRRCFDDA